MRGGLEPTVTRVSVIKYTLNQIVLTKLFDELRVLDADYYMKYVFLKILMSVQAILVLTANV